MVAHSTVIQDLRERGETRRSRRWVLRSLGMGSAALVAAGTVGRLAAQEGTAVAGVENVDAPQFFRDFLVAWANGARTGDPSEVLPFYAEDAMLEDAPLNLIYQGLDQIAPFLAGFFGNYSDASLTWQSAFATTEYGAAEAVFQGNYTGQIPGLPAGTGQPLVTRSVHIYEFADDKIARQTLYFDSYGFLIQLGVLPAPGSATPES
jgi:steroid delta-isomerase-like uncharacterized protein